jgi:L-fuculose-phosphate aldolase
MTGTTSGGRELAAPVTENDARRALIDACLRMNALGINQGKAGNASMRWDRGGEDGLLITPTALPYEQLQIDDIVWISLRVQGDGDDARPACLDSAREPSSDWRMHRDVYANRADAQALVHAHGPHAASLSCSARVQRDGIPPFHYRVAIAGGRDIRCAPYASFGTQALSDHALRALQGRRACLLANHGLLAVGSSLAQALALAVEVEALARMYWQALQLGDLVLLDDAQMQAVAHRLAARD